MNDAVKSWLADPERVRILGAANPANVAKVAPNALNKRRNHAADSLRIGCESSRPGCESGPPIRADSQDSQHSQAGPLADSRGASGTWRRDSRDSQDSQAGKHPSFAEVENHLRRIALAARLPWHRMRSDPDGIRDVDIEDVREHWTDYTADPRFLRSYIAAVAYRLALDPEFIR